MQNCLVFCLSYMLAIWVNSNLSLEILFIWIRQRARKQIRSVMVIQNLEPLKQRKIQNNIMKSLYSIFLRK
jgi:hypothetical protein